ncbi:MAG: long-chain-fatty-acid--CoA ligase [Streptosporangiales bacterium]|nr:long-chain-fatty-acid--CoA ligase [Streptosporangiales bacterium]
MMDRPLLLKRLLWRAENVFGDKEIITRLPGGYHSYTYADYGRRTRQLAKALEGLGVRPGDRVGTLAWNHHRHFEAYFGVPCMGGVLHTINLRLFPEQIAFIVNHAGDRVLLVDPDQLPLVEELADRLETVEAFVVLGETVPPGTSLRPVYAYEELLADRPSDWEFPEFGEDAASGMCYTSGTTGDPKGVLYTHRSTVLHTLGLSLQDSFGVGEAMRLFLITPMFHANAWGLPFAAAMQGSTLILPGVHPEPRTYLEVIEDQRATHAVGAVTVGVLMRDAVEGAERAYDLSSLDVLWLGGQAPPRGLMEWWKTYSDTVIPQGWGMTEASPLLTYTALRSKYAGASEEERYRVRVKQGIPLPLAEIRLVGERGEDLPWDGKSVGEYAVRAPWTARAYYNDPRTAKSFVDGWFRTGDVGVIDPDGYVHLVDRVKDLVKSGGEWISSVELENSLMAHPKVAEAAVIGIPDETWMERPLACITPRGDVDRAELMEYLSARFAKWWVPTEYVFLHEVPKTGTGKFDKKALRARYADPAARREERR